MKAPNQTQTTMLTLPAAAQLFIAALATALVIISLNLNLEFNVEKANAKINCQSMMQINAASTHAK